MEQLRADLAGNVRRLLNRRTIIPDRLEVQDFFKIRSRAGAAGATGDAVRDRRGLGRGVVGEALVQLVQPAFGVAADHRGGTAAQEGQPLGQADDVAPVGVVLALPHIINAVVVGVDDGENPLALLMFAHLVLHDVVVERDVFGGKQASAIHVLPAVNMRVGLPLQPQQGFPQLWLALGPAVEAVHQGREKAGRGRGPVALETVPATVVTVEETHTQAQPVLHVIILSSRRPTGAWRPRWDMLGLSWSGPPTCSDGPRSPASGA